MTRAMTCLPLGFGTVGEPTPVRWDGRTFDCIPFHVEVGGIRVVQVSPSHHSLTQYPGAWDVMIDRHGPLAAHLREVVAPAEAERLLAILEAPDLAGWTPPDHGQAWITADAMRCIDARDPQLVCQLLRRARDEAAVSFGCLTIFRRLAGVTIAELAHVLAVPEGDLRARLAARGGLWTR